MGLVVSRGVGDAFWVDDDRFHVHGIGGAAGCILMDRRGSKLEISASSPTALLPDVLVQEGIRRAAGLTRLVITAPRHKKILRGEHRESAACIDDSQSEAALLAPVPHMHLVSGFETCRKMGKVAFGSRAWETFRDLKEQLAEGSCPVLLYASWDKAPFPPKATWQATYAGFVKNRAGRYPGRSEYRPETTCNDSPDSAVFWEVRDLRPVNADQALEIGKLFGFRSKRQYSRDLRPERPLMIENPFIA